MAEEEDVEQPETDQPEDAQPAGEEEERKPLSWRDLPRVVNLKDFAQMVGSEAEQIGTSFRMSPYSG